MSPVNSINLKEKQVRFSGLLHVFELVLLIFSALYFAGVREEWAMLMTIWLACKEDRS